MMCSVFIFQLQRIFPRQLVPQAVVDALLCQQLVVGAGFYDALFAQHKDAVVVVAEQRLRYLCGAQKERRRRRHPAGEGRRGQGRQRIRL